METLITYAIPALILGFFLLRYYLGRKERDAAALESAEKGKLHSSGPQSQHPHVDMTYCIGCASCTLICPEGDVLVMLGGKAVIVNGHKCIGHSLCAEACPVGAITMVMASPSVGSDNPYLSPEYETTIPNMFIVGELGGLALIKNAVNQGRDCVDTITKRFAAAAKPQGDVYELLVVGSGPAGISAALRAAENKLKYVILEQEEMLGGTVAKYPKQKLVMTSPWQFPTYGKFKKTELSKEELIGFWEKVMQRADFNARTGEKVTDIKKDEDGNFTVVSGKGQYRSRAVVLALGKTGSPRKLGVKGEEQSKVMYRLIEADHYINKQILIVGGGDSAVEAAMGLGNQVGNKVILSYRKETFARIKERNTIRVQECVKAGTLTVIFNSMPVEIKEKTVMLEVNGKVDEIPNDFVWIFAGGEPPTAFLKKIGIGFGVQDVTAGVSSEAKQAKKDLAEVKREAEERPANKPGDTTSVLPDQVVPSAKPAVEAAPVVRTQAAAPKQPVAEPAPAMPEAGASKQPRVEAPPVVRTEAPAARPPLVPAPPKVPAEAVASEQPTVEAAPAVPAETLTSPRTVEAGGLGVPGKDVSSTRSEKSFEPVLGIPGEDLPKVAYRLTDAQMYEGKDILVVGGGDLAIRAALALGYLGRNRVSMSFRGDTLLATARNRQLIRKLEEEKNVRMLKSTKVAEITPDSVVVSVGGSLAEIPNDLVFILVGDGPIPDVPQPMVHGQGSARPTAPGLR